MAGIIVRGFNGMRPIANPKVLNATEAESATDVRLFSGAIQPIQENTTVTPLKISVTAETIYRVQNNTDEALNWFEFSTDVDVALSPITQDQHARVYWTGQGNPKMAPVSVAFSSGSDQYPRASYDLGIPKPTIAPLASGSQISEPALTNRTYKVSLTKGDDASESGLSESFTLSAMSDSVDTGRLYPSTFSAESSSLHIINFEVEHNLENLDYIAFTNSSESGWNTKWQVDSVESTKKIKIKNTSTFPSNPPSGSFTLRKRYLPTVTFSDLPVEQNEDGATHKNIYRLTSGTYRKVGTVGINESDFEDHLSDTESASQSAIETAVLSRPEKPNFAPSGSIPFDDDSVTRNESRNISVKKVEGTGASTLFTTEIAHKLKVGDEFTIDGISGNKTILSVNSSTVVRYNSTGVTHPAVPFSIQNVSVGTASRVYGLTYKVLDGTESAVSDESAVFEVVDGATQINVSMSQDVPSEVVAKRLYRQDITYSSDGTYVLSESDFKLVKELPASQRSYKDSVATSSLASNASPSFLDGLNNPQDVFGAVATLPPKNIAESRNYVYTYVSAYGEEGEPSEPSDTIDIDPYEPVTVQTLDAPSGNFNITKKYIYRTSSGTGDTNYQFVKEIPVATTSTSDNLQQVELGELITSTNYEAPPSNMKGLKVMANGVMVGFSGKDVCFSEAYLPHAWSSLNFLTVDHNIVGLGTFGQSVVILTESIPYIATGIDPSSMSLIKTSLQQACLSKRSIIETGSTVFYASPDGLVSVGLNGANVITSRILSQAQWQSYNPSSIHAYYHENKYYAFYRNSTTSGLLIFSLDRSDAIMSLGSQYSTSAQVVPLEDSLYIIESGNIKKMDKASNTKSYTWKSKLFEFPKPTNFSTAQVVADDYGDGVSLTLYADGSAVETKTISSDDPFRLQGGYLASDWQIQVQGSATITSLHLSHSLEELSAK